MEKKLVFTLITFSVIFSLGLINGCELGDASGSAVESVCKTPYFEYKVGDCCLDSNNNSICDSDETIVDEAATEETTTTTTTTTTEEVEITVKDACTDTTYFECTSSYLTEDEVFLKFETRREGFVHLKEVSALGCKKEFADKDKAINGYPIRTDVLVSLPCQKFKAGDEVEDAEYIIKYTFYPDDGFINPDTGEWEGATRAMQISSGQISGTVRNEPKKIL